MTARAGDLAIRPAEPGDYPAVRAIAEAASRAAPRAGIAGRAAQDARRTVTPETFASCVETGHSYVATVRGAVAGYLLTQPIAFAGVAPLTLWVEDIAVNPAHQRRSIATALYRTLGAGARAAGVQGTLVRLRPDDTAGRALHRRIGFEPHIADTFAWRFD
jgi:predicted N-acetyltransferase YhbS